MIENKKTVTKIIITSLYILVLALTFAAAVWIAIKDISPYTAPGAEYEAIQIAPLVTVGPFVTVAALYPALIAETDLFFLARFFFLQKEKTDFEKTVNKLCGIMTFIIILVYLALAIGPTALKLFNIHLPELPVMLFFFPALILFLWCLAYAPLRIIYFIKLHRDKKAKNVET